MGVYEDIMATLTGAADSFASGTGMGRFDEYQRARAELEAYAASRGWDKSKDPLGIQLSRDFPDEFAAVEAMNPAGGVALSAGMLPSAAAARGALPPPRAATGEVIPPPRPAGSPPPSSGPIIDGTSYTPPPPPRATSGGQALPPGPPPPPPAGASAASPAPSPQGGSASRWAIPGIIAASALPVVAGAMQRNTARAATSAPQGEYGRGAGPTEAEIEAAGRQQAHLDQVERERQRDHVLDREEREAQVAAAKALAAKAEAERKQLEQAMAQSDMTESEKVEARKRLQELQDQRAGERQAAQITADARNTDVRIASDNRNTDARIASDNRNTDARIASDNRNTDVREAGANTRAIYQGDVDMRGQDQRAREAQDNFVTTMIANRVQAGQLSVDKANKYLENYFKAAKLPSDILKQVSDSIQPFLPYMTNRSAGESAPGFEKGGAMEQMVKMGGGKYDPSKYKATSDFNLMDIAAQYGGGPPSAPIQAPDVNAVFSAIPDVDTNPDSYRGMSASSTQLARPQMGGGQTPPMVDSLMPKTMTPPMATDAEQRIYNSLGW